MAEIKRKPSLKPDLVFGIITVSVLIVLAVIAIGFLAVVSGGTGILAGLGGFLAFSPLIVLFVLFIFGSSLVLKLCTTYTITEDNEIIIHYSFIRTMTLVYRLDQLTSLRYQQNFVERWLGLGTFHFGVFGQKDTSTQQGQQQKDNVQRFLERKMVGIDQPEEIYQRLSTMLGISEEPVLYSAKPVVKPVLLRFLITCGIYLVFSVILLLLARIIPDFAVPALIGFGVVTFIIILFMLGQLIDWLKLRKTTYAVSETTAYRIHDYLLSKQHMVVPLGKITNTRTIRNVFSYLLFKAGSLQVFTGGSDDPYLRLFREYEDYSEIVSQKYGTVRQRIKDATNDSQKATYEEYRPGMSYLVNTLFANLVFWGIVGSILGIVIYLVPEIPVWVMGIVVGVVIFWLLAVLMIRIWQRSVTRYYLYENKLVIRYGIITLRSEELYYRNIKYLKLTRPYLFTRLLDEGTIHLYTAGTGGVDNRVSSIKAYKKVYEYLRGKVLEE